MITAQRCLKTLLLLLLLAPPPVDKVNEREWRLRLKTGKNTRARWGEAASVLELAVRPTVLATTKPKPLMTKYPA